MSELDDLHDLLNQIEGTRAPLLTLDRLLDLVAGAGAGPANGSSLIPAAILGGIEIVTSDFLSPGQMLVLGARAYAVSAADYERVRGRKVLPFRPGALSAEGGER